jgi:REP element-mobilizing transposase RayT
MEENLISNNKRKSEMEFGEPYFWTNTIYQWKHLLKDDSFKDIIISSLQFLSNKKLIEVYGFVIMPNHIHLLWQLNKMNGKEKPNASFQKYTAIAILENVKNLSEYNLLNHKVDEYDREFRIWQRDPLATILDSGEMAEAKLNYIHNNPIQEHWSLVAKPEDYKYSSARYYETMENEWSFLKHYKDRFGN